MGLSILESTPGWRYEPEDKFRTNSFKMAQTGTLGSCGDPLLNIFPNPCKGDTFLYTDDLEAAWVAIMDSSGVLLQKWPIRAGTTLHIELSLGYGTYILVLIDPYENILGKGKSLFISESH